MKYMMIILLACQFGWAESHIHFSDAVVGFKASRGNRQHRSGLTVERRKDYLSSNELEEKQVSRGRTPYLVYDSLNCCGLDFNQMKQRFESRGFTLKKTSRIYEFLPDAKSFSIGKVDTNNLQEVGENAKSKIFSGRFLKEIDLANTSFESTQNSNGEIKVTTYALHYYRVFEGRVIRDQKNFVDVDMDTDGKILRISVAWLMLNHSSRSLDITEGDNVSEGLLMDALKTGYGKAVKGRDTIEVQQFEVKGMADAWCPLEDGNTLVPCVSYSFVGTGTNNESVPAVIDLPVSKSY